MVDLNIERKGHVCGKNPNYSFLRPHGQHLDELVCKFCAITLTDLKRKVVVFSAHQFFAHLKQVPFSVFTSLTNNQARNYLRGVVSQNPEHQLIKPELFELRKEDYYNIGSSMICSDDFYFDPKEMRTSDDIKEEIQRLLFDEVDATFLNFFTSAKPGVKPIFEKAGKGLLHSINTSTMFAASVSIDITQFNYRDLVREFVRKGSEAMKAKLNQGDYKYDSIAKIDILMYEDQVFTIIYLTCGRSLQFFADQGDMFSYNIAQRGATMVAKILKGFSTRWVVFVLKPEDCYFPNHPNDNNKLYLSPSSGLYDI